MATANVPRNTPSDQIDPHLEWERLLRTVENGYTPSGDDEARQAEQYALEDRIAETPAHTLAGVMAQLRVALSYVEIGSGTVSDCDVNALRNALATLERLEAAS